MRDDDEIPNTGGAQERDGSLQVISYGEIETNDSWILDSRPLDDDGNELAPPELPVQILGCAVVAAVRDLPMPAVPYVLSDSAGEYALRRRGCMNVGPLLYYKTTRTIRHVPLPCYGWTCPTCAPGRSARILHAATRYMVDHETIYVHAQLALSVADLDALLRTATQAIQGLAGQYLWLVVRSKVGFVAVLFSNVDHSTRRRNRGKTARRCEPLTSDDALRLLDLLLWHGIEKRASSRGWPLTDGERSASRSGDSVRVGVSGARNAERVEPTARRLYESRRERAAFQGDLLPGWADRAKSPPLDQAETLHLYAAAVTEIHRQNRHLSETVEEVPTNDGFRKLPYPTYDSLHAVRA